MTSQKKSAKSQALLKIGLALVVLVLINIISIRLFGRLDMTERSIFSLSEASKKLVGSLDDKIIVKAFFTEDLPPPYNNNRRALLDQLNEYKAYSTGNLQFEFIDPTGEKTEQEAQQQGVVPVQVQVVNEDRFEAKRAFMGVVFLYEDKKEVIPVVQNMSSLEYDISSTIKRLTTRTRKKVGFLSGHGEPGLNELTRVQQDLSKQYDVTPVDAGTNPVPEDITTLIVMAPKTKIQEAAKYNIDQFIMRGGRVAFLLNRVEADLQQQFGRRIDVGVEDLLENYGLQLNNDIVRDVQCANISIVQQQFGFQMQSQVPFPYLPVVSSFSQDNVMVKDLKGLVLFFASSVDTTALAGKGLTAEVFMKSSTESGRKTETEYFPVNPLERFAPADFLEKEIPLGVIVSGEFKSLYATKPVPQDTSAGMVPNTPPILSSPRTRIILIGDGDFARDQYLSNKDNLTIIANLVDYLSDDAGLITIRSKDVSLPPLEQVSEGTKKMIKYGNMFLPPVLVLVFGLVRWRMRKARRKALEIR